MIIIENEKSFGSIEFSIPTYIIYMIYYYSNLSKRTQLDIAILCKEKQHNTC